MAYTVGMVSLGCPKNQIDAEMMLDTIKKAGYDITGDENSADAVIVNTCGFIESAKSEAIENILELAELKKEGRLKALIVTGCLAERYRDEILKEMPEVDAVVGIGKNGDIAEIINQAISGRKISSYGEKEDLCIESDRIVTTPSYTAYVKIAEGCDNCCTYCTIPQIRGKFRSRKIESIVAEVRKLAQAGTKEIILVAQDTTRYGIDVYGRMVLPTLLKELCKIEGIEWIRLLYTYPDCITDELLDTMAAEEKIVNYLDIPLQHCDGDILKRMNRSGDRASLTELFGRIRAKLPDVTLRTTLITGFPGESEEQFEQLCEFVSEIEFDRLGCFAYSAEEGTIAAEFPDQIDNEVKQRRSEVIMDAQLRVVEKKNSEMQGKVIDVLVEGYDDYIKCCFGRSRADAPDIDAKVFFMPDAEKPSAGDIVKVEITDTIEYDLLGQQI